MRLPSLPGPSPKWTTSLLLFILLLGVAFSFAVLLIGIRNPILDNYYFRQAQTAISAYWIAKGGPWFAYETPVLGAPWAIPFEFPVYQLIVAALSKAHVPIDVAGRVVNYAFFLMILWPLGSLARTLRVSPYAYLAVAILFVFSPFYVYWSRTVLIENCALFFGVSWLALLASFLRQPRWPALLGALAAGTLAVLSKSTTLPPFLMLGGLGTLWVLIQGFKASERMRHLAVIATGALVVAVVPLAIGLAWVAYSDAVKSANPFGKFITSEALTQWNFGTLDQKLSLLLWKDVILQRAVPDILGSLYFVALIALPFAAQARRSLALAGLALLAFLFPFVVFTNLHIVHTYYQVSNGVFLIIAVGLCVGAIIENGRPLVALALLLLLIGGQVSFFLGAYKTNITMDQRYSSLYRAAMLAKSITTPEQSIMMFGDDWSSAVNYYAERKGIAVPLWTPKNLFERIAANPNAFLGEYPLGAIVTCQLSQPEYPLLQKFLAGRRLIAQVDACRVYAPDRN